MLKALSGVTTQSPINVETLRWKRFLRDVIRQQTVVAVRYTNEIFAQTSTIAGV